MNPIISKFMNGEDQKLRKFGDLSREEKEDFILSVTALKIDTEERSRKMTHKQLSLLAESKLHVQIAPSTLGKILKKGGYLPYLLDRIGLDERFRERYSLQEIELLRLIPVTPHPQLSHLYDAREKGIPTERAKEMIRKLEYDGLIEQSPDARGYLYFNYVRTDLGKKLTRAINKEKYIFNLARDAYLQIPH